MELTKIEQRAMEGYQVKTIMNHRSQVSQKTKEKRYPELQHNTHVRIFVEACRLKSILSVNPKKLPLA